MTFEEGGGSNRSVAAGNAEAPASEAAASQSAKAQAAPAGPSLPPQIEDFDELIKKEVQAFVGLGEKIGGLVAEQVRYCQLVALLLSVC